MKINHFYIVIFTFFLLGIVYNMEYSIVLSPDTMEKVLSGWHEKGPIEVLDTHGVNDLGVVLYKQGSPARLSSAILYKGVLGRYKMKQIYFSEGEPIQVLIEREEDDFYYIVYGKDYGKRIRSVGYGDASAIYEKRQKDYFIYIFKMDPLQDQNTRFRLLDDSGKDITEEIFRSFPQTVAKTSSGKGIENVYPLFYVMIITAFILIQTTLFISKRR